MHPSSPQTVYRDEEAEPWPAFASRLDSGALGSGLAIFSRFPIISTHTLPYSLSGLPLHVIAGDFFVNKAAGSCVLLHPKLGEVEVWSTHVRQKSARRSAPNTADSPTRRRCTLPTRAPRSSKLTEWHKPGNWLITSERRQNGEDMSLL